MKDESKKRKKAADRRYAKRSGLDVEVAGQLGRRNGRHNAFSVTEKDKEAEKQKDREKNEE